MAGIGLVALVFLTHAVAVAVGSKMMFFPSRLWCWAMPQHQSKNEAAVVWRHLQCKWKFRADVTCCSLDKVRSVLEYAEAVLTFKQRTMQQQREFADGISQGLGRSSSESSCHPFVSGLLRRRVDALIGTLVAIPKGYRRLRRMLQASLCSHCLLPRGPTFLRMHRNSLHSDASTLARIMHELAELASKTNEGDMLAWKTAERDGLQSCVPAAIGASLSGISMPLRSRADASHGVCYPFSRDFAHVRTWHAFTDRFCLALSRFVGKLAFQMKIIMASFEVASAYGPQRNVFWTSSLLVQPNLHGEAESIWRWPNYGRVLQSPIGEMTAALALVIHISNHTPEVVVDAAWNQASLLAETSEALSVLFVEDSIREAWVSNERPLHAASLAAQCRQWQKGQFREQLKCGYRQDANPTSRKNIQPSTFEVVWRRHQATLSHEKVAALLLGPIEPGSGAVVLDLRNGSFVGVATDDRRADRDLGLLHVFRQHGVKPPIGKLKQGKFAFFSKESLRERAEDNDATLLNVLRVYIDRHRNAVRHLRENAKDARRVKSLIYVCNPLSLCGGHGDRTNGMLSVFLLAILTDRAFFIDSDSPLPLNLLLQPRRDEDGDLIIDWRLRGGAIGSADQNFYLDDRVALQSDLSWLIRDPSPVLLVSMNLREFQAILTHPMLRNQVTALGLQRQKHLVSQLWDMLFEPTPALRERLYDAATELQLRGPLPWLHLSSDENPSPQLVDKGRQFEAGFIGIHFRAGNESARLWWDPGRHPLSSLPDFLECAARAEAEIGLPSDTKWFLSADTSHVLNSSPVVELRQRGKLVTLGDDWNLAHVDRSHVDLGLRGFADSYVAYMLLASSRAIILSRSYFGETAAEIGAIPMSYFAEGCVRTDLHSS